MDKYIFTLLLLVAPCSVLAQEYTAKIKAIQHGDTFSTKLMLKSPMIGEEESKGGGVWGRTIKPISYITRITASSNNNKIFNIDTNPFLSHNPIFKLKIKNAHVSNTAKLIVEYNSGDIKTKIFTIKNAKLKNKYKEKSSLIKSKNSLFWSAETIDKAIEILYGTKKMIENVIDVQVPKVASSSNIPISIRTNIDLESIVVLMSGNPRSAVAMISIPSGRLLQFDMRVRPIYPIQVSENKNGEYNVSTKTLITVIGKSRNGKIYKTTKFSELGICVNSGGGLENYQIEELYKIQHQQKIH